MNNSKVTYHQQVSYCGKPRCRKCREGTGHGPYWYAYKTVDGRTSRTYIGKELPVEAREALTGPHEPEPPSAHAEELAQSHIRIYTLGQFRLERRNSRDPQEWQTATDSAWQHQRVRWLLAGLVSQPSRRMGREQLLELLWPDLDLETASSRMDRSVYSLRQIFEPQRAKLAQSPLLLTERELLILGDHPQVWIDADVFEKLIIEAREIGEKDLGKKESLLMEAMSLYGGAFLPELRKSEWTQSRRETLLRSFISLLLDLADVRSKRDAWQGALEPLNKLLSLDPTNEAAVQRLMMLLFRLERRSEALQAYSRLGGFLKRDFNIAPLPETRAIYEKVRSGTLPDKTPVSNQAEKEQRHIPPLPPTLFGRSHASPLVGRQDEIHLLSGMLKEIETSARFRLPGQKKSIASPLDTQRRPHCVLLMGEVGIGKTRLAEEASREAKRGNWAVAWSRVYSQEGSIPYRIWTEVLRRAMEQGLWQRQEFQRRATILQPLTALLPDLQELFPPSTFNLNQSPEREQLRLWEAALELLTMISENTPLMIALDDLQWADSSSCDLLAYLARRINGYPIFIVGTCRENELTQNHALRPLLTDLLREHAVEQVALLPLEDKEIEALVSHVARLPETMVQQIGERAGGNPFFAEELGRALGAETPSTNGRVVLLPETITAVLDMRLGRLSQECQNMLRKAAILGRSFEFPQIAAMEAGTLDYNDDSADLVLDRLEEALASGMITEEGTGIRITYQFWHPLLVSHLSERLSAARRANLHRRAAEILRHDYRNREEEGAAIITDHLVDGGADRVLIARYSELAGNRSYNLSDFPGAEKYYRIALEHIDEDDSNKLHQTYLYEYLGECTRTLGKTEDARVFYQRALNGYNQNITASSSDEVQQKAQIIALLYSEIAATWYDARDNSQALSFYERGEAVLKEANVLQGAVWAILKLRQCYIFWQEGSYEKTLHNAHESLRLFEEVLATQSNRTLSVPCSARIARTLSGDPADLGRTYVLLGSVTDAIGQPSQAVDYLNKALAILEQDQRYREIATVYCTLGDLYLRKAEFEQAQAAIRNSVTLAEKVGDDALLSIIFCNQGILLTRFGDLVEAEIYYKKGLLLTEKVNDPFYTNILLVSMYSVLQDQGKISETEKCLLRALKIGRSIRSNFCVGSALVAIGTMRIYQFLIADQGQSKKRILKKAHSTLLHALSLEGMEAQTQTEGMLALAYVELLQGQIDLALEKVKKTLEDAQKHELLGLIARSHQLLGCILVAQNQYEQAYIYFEKAKDTFSKRSMRLEYARTLYHFGSTLFQQNLSVKERVRGSSYLHEAQQICIECKAVLDLQLVERALSQYEIPSTQVI